MLQHTVTYQIAGQNRELVAGFLRAKRITTAGAARIVTRLHNADARIGTPRVRESDVSVIRLQVATLAR